LATTGRDVVFDLGRVEGYRNFCNKLWNAARYVLMNTEGQDTGVQDGSVELSLADRWIDSRLQAAVKTVNESLRNYRLDLAAQSIYEFLWSEYCDWYLELSKPVLTEATASETACRGTRRTLVQVLESVLRLAHPLMPFITEEIWQRVAPLAGVPGETVMLQSYPLADPKRVDETAEAEMNWVQHFLLGVRRIRAEMNIAPGKPLPVLLANGSAADRQRLNDNRIYLTRLGRLSAIDWLSADGAEPESAIALVGEMKILIPLAGLIDKEAEIVRLSKEIDKLRKELAKSEAKLENGDFIQRAPAPVVAKERERQAEMGQAVTRLDEQLQRMQRL
jgi:valyl-tRNA synthetase